MLIVYFKTRTSEPVGLLCTRDGRIDFSRLAQKFKWDPTSIELNGILFPSDYTWEQIKAVFKENELAVGAKDDPVLVAGEAAVPAVSPREDKIHDLHSAEKDLRSKVKPLNPMFYGRLKFIVGYIAADSQLQWVYIGRNGSKDLYRIGSPLNLLKLADRCSFLLSLGYLFQLFQKMADSVPDVPGRRAMFSVDESSSKKRTSFFYPNKVVKHIRDFWSYSAGQGTDLSVIRRAYTAARGYGFLLQSETGPSVSAHGTYRVECTPLGYSAILESEEDCRLMVQCLCHALCVLHAAGLLHRDIRLPNIVRLSETEFMLIDFESVAECPFRLPKGFRRFYGWHLETLEGDLYTPHSDMYSLGILLEEALPHTRTLIANEFVNKLINKQLSAADALQEPWLLGK